MSLFLSNRDGGLTDEQGHYRFQTNVWSGNVIGNGLQVTQNSPLGMSVIVGPGDARVPYADYAYTAWNDANEVVTISTADPSNPRIDRLVMYIDRGETPQQVNPNNPGIPKFAVVAGTPAAVPTRPDNTAVNSAVGATNPWIDLSDIRVNAGVTQITNSNITDTRQSVHVATTTPHFKAYRQTSYNVPDGTFAKVPLNVVQFDSEGGFDTTLNRYVVQVSGMYNLTANIAYEITGNIYRYILCIYVNNSERARLWDGLSGGNAPGIRNGSVLLSLSAGDYVEMFMWHNVGSTRTEPAGANSVFLSGFLL